MTAPAASTERRTLLAARLWLAIAVPASVATVLGFLGHWSWALDLISHFRAQYAVLLVLSAAALLLARQPRAAALAALFAAVNVVTIAPLYVPAGPPQVDARVYRLVFTNVNKYNERESDVVAFVRSAGADFVLAAEVTPRWASALEPLKAEFATVATLAREDYWGKALLSRFAPSEVTLHELPSGDYPALVAQFDLDGRALTLVAGHPIAPVNSYAWADRNAILADLAAYAARLPGPRLVCGDLNLSPWSPFFDDFLQDSALRDARRGFGLQTTWPAGSLPLRVPLDHCLASPEISIHDFHAGPALGSDHLPIVVDFSIAGP